MKTLLSAALAAALIPCLALPAAAQNKKNAAEKDGCRVRCLVAEVGSLPDELHVHDAAGSATAGKLRVKSFLNHEFDILAPKGGPVVITTKAEPASVKTPEDVVAQCELPAKAPSLILFLSQEAPDKPQCKVTVIDASAKAFPSGSFKVVNLSTLPVTIELETKKYEFKPGANEIIKDPPMGADSSASMKAFCERDGKQEQIGSGIWPSPGEKRVLQIIMENPDTKRVEIVGVRDVAKP